MIFNPSASIYAYCLGLRHLALLLSVLATNLQIHSEVSITTAFSIAFHCTCREVERITKISQTIIYKCIYLKHFNYTQWIPKATHIKTLEHLNN